MSAKRLFVCIELPETVRQHLAEMDPHLRGVRWLEPRQTHLTLSFLGDVASDTQETLMEKLRTMSWKSFFLPLVGLGTFPSKGWPGIVWIGVGTGHPHLFQLHKRVQEAVLAAGLEPDLRAFHPHVTLARCRDVSPETIRHFLKAHPALDAGMIHVESFRLNSSELTPAGSVYTPELIVRSV
ncbi:MAG TPA: RNA 2',3'-cyclic phosphodiesterase [Chthoniobacterales bacterium]|nr:RNA 2',3'-cyclic phosphodiesterase [Chthoniobacterales bacterium]